MNGRLTALSSLALRIFGVSGKFIALFVLAERAGSRAVGEFGIFIGATNIGLFVIGLDFYQFALRELLAGRDSESRLRVILGQGALDAVIYLVVISCGVLCSTLHPVIATIPVAYFAIVLALEHATQQLSRIFTMLRRPNAANTIYALKTGLWAWIAGGAVYAGFLSADVANFYKTWIVIDLASLLVGSALIWRMFSGTARSLPAKYGAWLRRGVGISRRFYVTSVATMCLAYVDRFIVARRVSVEEAGLFAFWQSIASLLPVVAYAMAGMHALPRLVEAYKRNRPRRFEICRRHFLARTMLISLGVTASIVVMAPWIPAILGKPGFSLSIGAVALMAAGSSFYALWQVPYQVLYSADEDRFLAASIVSVTAISTLVSYMLISAAGVNGAILSYLVSNGVMYYVLDRRARRHIVSRTELKFV